MEQNINMSTQTVTEMCLGALNSLGCVPFILTLSPGSPGLPGAPEEPGGPGRPYSKQDLILHTSYINNATQRKKHICWSHVLSVLSQSGHTWGKGMREAIWEGLSSCKSFVSHFFICPQLNA